MVKNWKYYTKRSDIGELRITEGQYMTGNILGILVEEKDLLEQKGNLANAKTFGFPVRYKTVKKYTGFNYDDVAADIKNKIVELELEGCRVIITSGGQMGYFRSLMHEVTDLLVLSTPVEIIEFVSISISENLYLCIVNDLAYEDNVEILRGMGIHEEIIKRCIFVDTKLCEYRDCEGQVIDCDIHSIGAYVWDSIECVPSFLAESSSPVYSIVNLAYFLKNVVMQIPYEGGI